MKLEKLISISSELGELLKERDLSITCAESCTGGWVGQAITSVPGCSKWFSSSFVTYSYKAKSSILGVSPKDLTEFGAVSEEIVKQMVSGAITKTSADVGIGITGIAGPTGATDSKPLGTVCFAWKILNHTIVSSTEFFSGERNQVRYLSVERALLGTINLLKDMK